MEQRRRLVREEEDGAEAKLLEVGQRLEDIVGVLDTFLAKHAPSMEAAGEARGTTAAHGDHNASCASTSTSSDTSIGGSRRVTQAAALVRQKPTLLQFAISQASEAQQQSIVASANTLQQRVAHAEAALVEAVDLAALEPHQYVGIVEQQLAHFRTCRDLRTILKGVTGSWQPSDLAQSQSTQGQSHVWDSAGAGSGTSRAGESLLAAPAVAPLSQASTATTTTTTATKPWEQASVATTSTAATSTSTSNMPTERDGKETDQEARQGAGEGQSTTGFVAAVSSMLRSALGEFRAPKRASHLGSDLRSSFTALKRLSIAECATLLAAHGVHTFGHLLVLSQAKLQEIAVAILTAASQKREASSPGGSRDVVLGQSALSPIDRGVVRVDPSGVVGTGKFGSVYLCRFGQRSFAMKMVKVRPGPHVFQLTMAVVEEAKFLMHLRHANVVRYIDIFGHRHTESALATAFDCVCIVMEYCDRGSLSDIVFDTTMALDDVMDIVRQLADALEYIHGRGVVHCDVKLENVLVKTLPGPRDLVKLGDFGLARTTAGAFVPHEHPAPEHPIHRYRHFHQRAHHNTAMYPEATVLEEEGEQEEDEEGPRHSFRAFSQRQHQRVHSVEQCEWRAWQGASTATPGQRDEEGKPLVPPRCHACKRQRCLVYPCLPYHEHVPTTSGDTHRHMDTTHDTHMRVYEEPTAKEQEQSEAMDAGADVLDATTKDSVARLSSDDTHSDDKDKSHHYSHHYSHHHAHSLASHRAYGDGHRQHMQTRRQRGSEEEEGEKGDDTHHHHRHRHRHDSNNDDDNVEWNRSQPTHHQPLMLGQQDLGLSVPHDTHGREGAAHVMRCEREESRAGPLSTVRGTLCYQAPESFEGGEGLVAPEYRWAVDIWCLGCLLWEAATQDCLPMGTQEAYLGMTALRLPEQGWQQVRDHFVAQLRTALRDLPVRYPQGRNSGGSGGGSGGGVRDGAGTHASSRPSADEEALVYAAREGLCRLLHSMWSVEPSQRPSAYDVVRLPFLDAQRFVFKAELPATGTGAPTNKDKGDAATTKVTTVTRDDCGDPGPLCQAAEAGTAAGSPPAQQRPAQAESDPTTPQAHKPSSPPPAYADIT